MPTVKDKKWLEIVKDELIGKFATKFAGLRAAKTYIYLIHDGSEDKQAKDTKKCVHKKIIKTL